MKQSYRKIKITVGLTYIAWNTHSLIDNILSYSLYLPMNMIVYGSIYVSICTEIENNA